MIVPSNEVKQFLFEVINKSAFPGTIVEFVAYVKSEIQNAKIGNDPISANTEEIGNTASDLMLEHQQNQQ